MSLRGFKRDGEASAHVQFLDKRSFMSQVKQIGAHGGIHFILFGKDKVAMRAKIFRRNRKANGGVNRCVKCGEQVHEHLEMAEDLNTYTGEWNHIRNKPGERCDCPENGEVVCGGARGCHRDLHPQPRWKHFARSNDTGERKFWNVHSAASQRCLRPPVVGKHEASRQRRQAG